MKTIQGLVIAALGLAGVTTQALGCFDLGNDCAFLLLCGSTGKDGGPVNCNPSQGAVDENCGVFVSVSKGNDGNDGSPGLPYKTLATAIANADGGRVYVCGEKFTEAVKLVSGVTLYGALDCGNGWTYDGGKKTVLTAGADEIPLTLAATATGASVADFQITAEPATKSGGSSIAVLVDHAKATFTRCDLLAQDAVDGEAGVSGGVQASQAEGGKVGGDAGPNGTGSNAGGGGGQNAVCSLLGGNGGNGGQPGAPPGNGVDGQPGDNGNGGPAGTGDTGAGCGGPNPNGGNGSAGSVGPVKAGIGSIDASGYHGIDGQDGGDGGNGKSGGGGGGSKGTATAHGAGGGGGGAGGCGGKKGTGGSAGGSSIALVSLNATITLAHCTLGAGKPGDGGAGGDGQFGQPGGKQGDGGGAGGGASSGCNGGKGGDGGNGGNGSGGLGGHSLGIAARGTAPELDAATKAGITPAAKGGSGGKGGNMDADANHGGDGMALACWDFSKGAACAQ